ncbi:ABC transporter ATP-binding protein [Cohnella sp. REN36]|uniref:ABC transporter ATP-binding protein n=1 Tax=Cohnella sp. REN36 TaxID=2887347 RepID=UPI001D134872|nr:ABC transporter ATP-binding protein [Cohnella sp. REN36]
MEPAVIELSKLTKQYGEFTAVNALDLKIRPGEIYGLLGPNGAGKTTTILMMLGLTEPTSGTVRVCGIDATRSPLLVKRRVGYMPDDIGFYEDRSALDNLIYTARLNRIPLPEARDRAELLLQQVGLAHAAGKRVGAFSRGMRQRLGLADVLIKRPEIIILDEPTLGIDPEGVRELLLLIRELSRSEGLTVLLSSHHLHQVQQICDRVGLFVGGKLIASGDIESLSRQLDGDTRFEVEVDVRDPDGSVAGRIGSMDGVISIETSPSDALSPGANSVSTYRVTSDVELTSALALAVVEHGAPLLGLRPVRAGLDDIYHRYFEGGAAHERVDG